jgi:hypothetical protein
MIGEVLLTRTLVRLLLYMHEGRVVHAQHHMTYAVRCCCVAAAP